MSPFIAYNTVKSDETEGLKLLGILPARYTKPLLSKGFRWWAHRDSNPEPTDYESGALTN